MKKIKAEGFVFFIVFQPWHNKRWALLFNFQFRRILFPFLCHTFNYLQMYWTDIWNTKVPGRHWSFFLCVCFLLNHMFWLDDFCSWGWITWFSTPKRVLSFDSIVYIEGQGFICYIKAEKYTSASRNQKGEKSIYINVEEREC